MSIELASDRPIWEQKLRYMARFYRQCSEEDRLDKFRAVYALSRDSSRDVTTGFGAEHKAFLDLHVQDIVYADVLPDDKKKLVGAMETNTREHETATSDVKALTDQLKTETNPDKASWRDKMEKSRQQTKEKSNEIIDNSYDHAISLINAMPVKSQPAAADLWSSMMDTFLDFLGEIWDGILSMVEAVVKWLVGMWEKIREGWNTVVSGFKAAWEWLSGLF